MKSIGKSRCCGNKKTDNNLAEVIEFLKIISEGNRIKILCILQERERCVCEIWKCLKIPQNLASHHLKVLKDFGLVASKQKGLKIFYSLNKKAIEKYLSLLNKFLWGKKS